MYKTKKLNQIMLKPTGESPGSEEKETFLALGTPAWTPPHGHRSPPQISYPALLRAREALACHNLIPSRKTR